MKAVTCLIILMALAYCVEGRERLGKIIKRQARHRDYKALQSPQSGLIGQSVVRNSFTPPQSQLLTNQPQVSEITVPLGSPSVGQAQYQYQQAQQQGAQTAFVAQQVYQNPNQPITSAQQVYPNQNQPITSQAAQTTFTAQQVYQNPNQPITSAQQVYQNPNQPITLQAAQTTLAAQQAYQNPNQPISSQAAQPQFVAQQVHQNQNQQQASYAEISLLEALQSRKYSQAVQAVQQAYQATPVLAQPISMRDETNKILMRLPSNASLIRPYITEGFSCIGRPYGYYADVANECQIFHVCFPLKSVFNNHPTVPDVTYEFSFICNEFTRFAQDSMTCGFSYEIMDCQDSESVYSINDHFFKITTPAPTPAPILPPGSYPSLPGPIGGSVVIPPGFTYVP